MKRGIILLVIITSTIFLLLNSCKDNNKSKNDPSIDIIGTWAYIQEDASDTDLCYTFTKDLKVKSTLRDTLIDEGTYTVENGIIRIRWNNKSDNETQGIILIYEYENGNMKLRTEYYNWWNLTKR